jgi:cysteine desulfurase
LEYMTDKFGNPSSIHYFGREAETAVEQARKQVAGLLGTAANEIFFTSGGTGIQDVAIS